jgi:hypothetical protein
MRVARQGDLNLDFCSHCRGVWFDHEELTGIWRLEVESLARRRRSTSLDTAADMVLLDVLLFDPFLTFYGVHAAGHVVGAAGEALAGSGAAEAVGEVAGAAGEAASSLFETIVEIIGGIFG